jgi:glycine/D-amino acid oxidase-like deaminating enzyme
MTDYLKLHNDRDEGGEDITRALRGLYAAPADAGYWRSLEARILARLTEARPHSIGWWDELDRWMRPALVAAVVMLLASGVALFRARQVEQETTYEAMLTPTSLPVETAVRPVLQEDREATFRYLMTSDKRIR